VVGLKKKTVPQTRKIIHIKHVKKSTPNVPSEKSKTAPGLPIILLLNDNNSERSFRPF
jgi:hypothetical protein